MKRLDAITAANRFGLGARPGDLARIGSNAKSWLREQINAGSSTPELLKHYPDSTHIMLDLFTSRTDKEMKKSTRKQYRTMLRQELSDRLGVAVSTNQPFTERLVLFWSNHFTVSSRKGITGPAVGAFEREAIRPNIYGSFEDLLLASSRHICMLVYLDNHVSVGPNSKAGKRSKRDLNENLGREILELHTVGVNGGYSQNDVTELAKALTGWTHGGYIGKKQRRKGKQPNPRFIFRAAIHEPGSRQVMGRTYPEPGEQQGTRILSDLARHPATARFIATKLVRHFVSDDPPDEAVTRIENVFIESGGNLAKVSHALIELDAAWQSTMSKIKTPYELVVSTYRAMNHRPRRARYAVNALKQMGHLPFDAPSPAGWPDTARHWLSPEGLLRRIEWARAVSATFDRSALPLEILAGSLGNTVSTNTRQWVERAPSSDAGLAMVFASHEFQRR